MANTQSQINEALDLIQQCRDQLQAMELERQERIAALEDDTESTEQIAAVLNSALRESSKVLSAAGAVLSDAEQDEDGNETDDEADNDADDATDDGAEVSALNAACEDDDDQEETSSSDSSALLGAGSLIAAVGIGYLVYQKLFSSK